MPGLHDTCNNTYSQKYNKWYFIFWLAQSAGVVEYTDCTSAEG